MTTQTAMMFNTKDSSQYNVLVAEVTLDQKLAVLAGTKYDPFEENRRYLYLLEIFATQTKTILNANRYDPDYMLHVPANEFELCQANEWFLANSVLDGFSPAGIEIDKDRYECISEQLENLTYLS